jgi:hypothetical protein
MRFTVSPSVVQVLTRDGFYVTVEGSGVGWLRCRGDRRWVFGTFREKFFLRNPPAIPIRILVAGTGLGGTCQAAVTVDARANLHAPAVFGSERFRKPLTLPVAPRLVVHAPSIRRLGARVKARWNEFLHTEARRRDET